MTRISLEAAHGTVGLSVCGSGPPLLLVAGLGSTARVWGDLPTVLGRHFTVVAVDNRGVGGSRGGAPFTLDVAAEDLVLVLDHLDFETASLLGSSMGGTICLQTAVTAPHRVRSLVLVSCAAHLSAHGRRSLELLHACFRHLPAADAGRVLMSLAFAPPFHVRFSSFVNEAIELYGPDPDDVPGTLQQGEHLLAGWDLRDQLGGVAMPTLVLAGGRDPIVACEDTRTVAEALPRAELMVVPDAAHAVLAEGGKEALGRVVEFLRKHAEPIGL